MKTKEDFAAACQALGKNDPRRTHLNLVEYGSLIDPKRVQQVVRALEKNTFVEDLTFSANLCVNSILQFNHFLKTSPSLQRLEIQGKSQGTDQDDFKDAIRAGIVCESISRSSVLVSLTLDDVLLGDYCPLEGLLSSTRTLSEFNYSKSNSTMTHQVAQAIGGGLAKNKSLVKLSWSNTYQGVDFLEEILFGLCDHISLKTLELRAQLTKTSSVALRSLLHFNGRLETLALTQLEDHEKIPTMVSVLAGLAQNTGLKNFSFESYSRGTIATLATLATAWINLLQRNTSITMLDLRKDDWDLDADADCVLSSAVAEGLVTNSTLETLYLPGWLTLNRQFFHGPVWQEMLGNNRCLKKLCFPGCPISLEGFECLARGLSHNTSLESLTLSSTNMRDDCFISLVNGLRTNKTLKYLDLSSNSALGQSGRAAIEQLIGYNVLKELNLANNTDSVGASILASGLSDNHSLEMLDLEGALVDGSETFRALCETLRGNTTLRHMDVRNNDMLLDDVCVTALKLDTILWRRLISVTTLLPVVESQRLLKACKDHVL